MITLPLTIRNAGQPLREPVAWLLPGAEPASWIEELVHWRVPLQQLTLYPLPKSEFDHAAGGVLVVSSNGPASAGAAPDTSHRRSFAVPYGVVANRIYLPVDAVLQPQADDRELLSLLASEIDVYVFHPTAGLIGFTRDQARRVSDLLQLPPRSETTWSHARPGVAFNQRLLSIALADPPSVREILEAGKGDIGSEAASIPQLPPLHDEPSNMPAA